MKLKTKLLLITCITILGISLFCNVILLIFMKSSFTKEAESSSLQNATKSFLDIEKTIMRYNESNIKISDNIIGYLMKKQADDYFICFKKSVNKPETIFNNTIFEAEELEDKEYVNVYYDNQSDSIAGTEFTYYDKHFRLYRMIYDEQYIFYKLEDVTYVQERMKLLTICLFGVMLLAVGMASVVMRGILNRVLTPLEKLNMQTKQIAKGDYKQRSTVSGRDEISELSENFNKMAEAVEERERFLEDSEQRKTLFMGNLTHELKTPLTAISGYSKTLLSVKLSEEDKQEALSYIYSESCRLERLSKKMMNLLLLEKEAPIVLKEISAREVFDKVKESCSKILEEKSIILECQCGQETFLVDEDLMTDVLINLIDNAVKASEPDSRIVLSAKEKSITVQDFGCGIPEEEQKKILEPFYMVDKSRSRKNGGAGLGLAITALILEKHNATLSVESEVGVGTCMILQFV